jgi:hypothetical protein
MKIGTLVKMVNCAESDKYKDRIWKTRSEPWEIGCGDDLVALEGYSGGFATRCLQEVGGDTQ